MSIDIGRKAHWEYGRYINERAKAGVSVEESLAELKEQKGTEEKTPSRPVATKLKTSYEIFVERYGFDINELENISPLNLWQAFKELKLAQNRDEAEALIARLTSGENLNQIRRERGVSIKSKAELYIERIASRLDIINFSSERDLNEVSRLLEEYKTLIQKKRENPSEADRLFVEFNLALIELLVNKPNK